MNCTMSQSHLPLSSRLGVYPGLRAGFRYVRTDLRAQKAPVAGEIRAIQELLRPPPGGLCWAALDFGYTPRLAGSKPVHQGT
jgi:hypothetical protein